MAPPQRPPPPDGGCAAWLRVAAYAIICSSTLGIMYAFSPLYVLLLVELQSSKTATAFVGSLASGMMDGMAIVVGVVIERIGYRRTAMLGAVLASAGMALSALCTQLWQLYLAYGLLMGFGISLAFFPPIVIMSSWFSKRLALTHAIANAASSSLSLVFGPTATPIFRSLGRRTAMLGLAAIMFVLLMGSSYFMTTPPPTGDEKTATGQHAREGEVQPPQPAVPKQQPHVIVERTPPPPRTRRPSPFAVFRLALRTRQVRLMCLISFFHGNAAWVPIVHLARIGLDCGLEEHDANTKLMFLAIGSLTVRIPIALVADRLGRRHLFAATALLYAAVCFVSAFMVGGDGCLQDVRASSAYLTFYAYMCGLTGALNSLLVSLPSELGLAVGEARAATTVIVSPLGAGLLVGPVVAGALHGVAARYREPLLFAGASLIVAAALTVMQIKLACCSSQSSAPSSSAEAVPIAVSSASADSPMRNGGAEEGASADI